MTNLVILEKPKKRKFLILIINDGDKNKSLDSCGMTRWAHMMQVWIIVATDFIPTIRSDYLHSLSFRRNPDTGSF